MLPPAVRPLPESRNRCCRPPPQAPRPRLPHDDIVFGGVDPAAPPFLAAAVEAAAAEEVVVEEVLQSAFVVVVLDDARDPPRGAAAALPVLDNELARTKPTRPPFIPWPSGREEDMPPGGEAPLPLLLVPKLLLLVPTAVVGAAGSKVVGVNPALVAPHLLGLGSVFPVLLLLLSPVRSTRPEGPSDSAAAVLLPVGADGVVVGDRAIGGWVGGGGEKKDRML